MKMKRMFISVVVTVFTILISSIFVGNISAQEQSEGHPIVKSQTLVKKHIWLHSQLSQVTLGPLRTFIQIRILHNLENYYALRKEYQMPVAPVYIASFFEIAQEIEKTAYNTLLMDKYEIAETPYFDAMQEDLIRVYEDCVAVKTKNPENAGYYYYCHRWEQALNAFSDAMQPEALVHFNKLKEQMHQ